MQQVEIYTHMVYSLDKTLEALNDAWAYSAGARLSAMAASRETPLVDPLEDSTASLIDSFRIRRADAAATLSVLGGTPPEAPWYPLDDYNEDQQYA